ncbi:hypothetical protein Peur_018169 [Populus x canadensis]
MAVWATTPPLLLPVSLWHGTPSLQLKSTDDGSLVYPLKLACRVCPAPPHSASNWRLLISVAGQHLDILSLRVFFGTKLFFQFPVVLKLWIARTGPPSKCIFWQ